MKTIANIKDYLFFQEGPGVRNTQYTNSGVKLLNVSNLVNGQINLENSDRYISEEEAYGKYKHFLVDEGDLVIASSGIKVEYFDKKMGFIKKEHLPLCMNTSTIRFKTLDKDTLDIRYFMYYLKSDHFKTQLLKQITGSAQLNFGPSHLKKMTFPLVEIQEQKELVKELDHIQKTIKNREKVINDCNILINSVFDQLFKDDKQELLGNLFNISSGGTPSTKKKEYWDGNIPWIGSNACTNNILYNHQGKYITDLGLQKSSAKLFPKDTVLVAMVGATIGKTALLKYETSTNQNIAGIFVSENKNFTSEYVFYALQRKYYIFQNKNTGFAIANLKFIKGISIPVPTIEKQIKFSNYVSSIEKLKKTVLSDINDLEHLFLSKMSKYFGLNIN